LIEAGRSTGNDWLDAIRAKWSKEKKRQKYNALGGWQRKCRVTYLSLWNRERHRIPPKPKRIRELVSWDELVTRSVHKVARESKEQQMSGWYKKVIRFCREHSQGRRNMSARKGTVSRKELFAKLESQGYRCALSGLALTLENAEADHVLPVQKGGETKIENIQWLHSEVNRMKGVMNNAEFVELCLRVSKHTLPADPPGGGLGPFGSQ
jgi:5-methylcytosine-specific restriction endonuclease McrA